MSARPTPHRDWRLTKPLPPRPVVPGGFVRGDFAVDHDARTVTCPAGHSPSAPKTTTANLTLHCAFLSP